MKRMRLTSTTAVLAISMTAAVSLACAAGAYFYSTRHFSTLLETARGTALGQGELVRAALEHAMVEEDRTLIANMIDSFASEPGVSRVMLLDRTGVVRHSSGPVPPARELTLDSPTCQACHRYPAAQRTSSRVIDTQGGALLRTVVPVRNRAECHGCHDPSHRINGIILLDMDAGTIRAAANRDLRWMVAGSAVIAFVLITALAIIVRLVVLRRLQRFETTARQICEGRLDQRVPTSGRDTISWLAQEFNVMADAVTGLLGQVHGERERLERVINSIDDGIVVLDEQRTVIAANDAFLARSQAERGRVLGCSCVDATGQLCGGCDCPTLACLSSGRRQVRVFERQRSDGSVAWEEVHASPVASGDGTPRQVVEVWRDITDRRAAEARLAESHRLASLGLLASGFSHEMNTPLATVLTCVEGIAREAGRQSDWQRVGESATIAREQILRCRGITQHFLRLSRGRPTAGEIVDVHHAAVAVVRLIEPTAREIGVAIAVESPGPDRLRVRANEADLHHALVNVLLNAVQAQAAAGAGGAVNVGLHDDGGVVQVRVRDSGGGIAPEHQKRIFEPFFSLRDGGTGLGLFLALNFVRQWGGDITLQSARGAGATFDIVLPALAASEPAVA